MFQYACGKAWLHEHEEGILPLAWLLGYWTSVWSLFFFFTHFLCTTLLLPRLPPSSETCFFSSQKVAAGCKSILVGTLANAGLVSLLTGSSFFGNRLAELAGVHFTCFELSDLAISFPRLRVEERVHHLVHIFMGILIMDRCGPALTANLLLAQETSGIFLNYYLLLRNRLPSHWTVRVSKKLFGTCFLLWRLGLGTFATLQFWSQPRASLFFWTLGTCLCIGSGLQWYWGVKIVKMGRRSCECRKSSV